jgi:hypothetical protein
MVLIPVDAALDGVFKNATKHDTSILKDRKSAYTPAPMVRPPAERYSATQ